MSDENPITPNDIVAMVKEEIILPDGGWERVEYKVEKALATEWGFTLDTELIEDE